MAQYARAFAMLYVVVCMAAFLALTIVRADHYLELNLFWIAIPIYALLVPTMIYYGAKAVASPSSTMAARFFSFGMVIVLIGWGWSFSLLTAKFEAYLALTYLACFVPAIACTGAGLLILIASVAAGFITDSKTVPKLRLKNRRFL